MKIPRIIVEHVLSSRINQHLIDARARMDKQRWAELQAHKKFVNGIMEFVVYWFQMGLFFYVSFHVIMMAHAGDTDKSINWALIALIIKPWGKEIRA